MKKVLFLAAFLVVFMCAPAFAQGKVGVINSVLAMANSEVGKQATAKMQERYKVYEEEMKAIGLKIQQLKAKGANQASMMKPEAIAKLQEEIAQLEADFQSKQKVNGIKFNSERNEYRKPVLELFRKVVGEYAKANGYSIIFDLKDNSVAYLDNSVNLTEIIIDEMNKASKK